MVKVVIAACPQKHYSLGANLDACPKCGQKRDRIICDFTVQNTLYFCLGCNRYFLYAAKHDYAACGRHVAWLERQ